jgi:hypothetical protein
MPRDEIEANGNSLIASMDAFAADTHGNFVTVRLETVDRLDPTSRCPSSILSALDPRRSPSSKNHRCRPSHPLNLLRCYSIPPVQLCVVPIADWSDLRQLLAQILPEAQE